MAGTIRGFRSRITWNPQVLEAHIQKHMVRRLAVAAERVTNQVKKNISISAVVGSGGSVTKGPFEHSKPGEYPRAITGRLRNSIFWTMLNEANMQATAIVGTPLLYGLYLEEGTRHIHDRSYLRRTLAEMWPRLLPMLTRPIPPLRAR